jgi:hypothetical protein
MAGPKLDGAGMAKLKTLEEALNRLQRLHGTVEQWALASKRNQPTSLYSMNVKRNFPPLATLLKGQFGMIADQIMSLNLASSRGAADGPKVRMLREGVAQLRQALEIAVTRTKEKHTTSGDAEREE